MNNPIAVSLVFFAIIILAVTMPIYFYLYRVSTDLLKNHHFSVWEKIGRPSLSFESSPKSSSNFIEFFLKKYYLEVGNDELNKLCNKIRIIFIVGFFDGFLLIISLCLYSIFYT